MPGLAVQESVRYKPILVALVITAVLVLAFDAAARDRCTLHLYRYGNTESPETQKTFAGFQEIITHKLLNISDELADLSAIAPLKNLAMRKITHARTGEHMSNVGISETDLHDYWGQQGALAVLYGRISGSSGNFSIMTDFYLGDIQGFLPSPLIKIRLPVQDREFDTTRDSHSAMTLYALAIDKRGECKDRDKVMQLLSEAHTRALAARDAFTTDFVQVESAIEREAERIKSACR